MREDMAVLMKENGGGGRPAKGVKTGSISGNRKAKFAIGKIKRWAGAEESPLKVLLSPTREKNNKQKNISARISYGVVSILKAIVL